MDKEKREWMIERIMEMVNEMDDKALYLMQRFAMNLTA